MRQVEAKLRALVVAHCDTGRYETRRPLIELQLLMLQVLVVCAVVWLNMFCLSLDKDQVGTWHWWASYGLLWLVVQYLVWMGFHANHEWIHENTTGWIQHLYLAVSWLGSVVANVESLPYYAMGHLDHHQFNGKHSLFQYLKEPWWKGKDADVLFFGFSLRNPFHSDLPLPLLVGPFSYLLYSGPGLVLVYIFLTVCEVLKFGASKNSVVVLSLQVVKKWWSCAGHVLCGLVVGSGLVSAALVTRWFSHSRWSRSGGQEVVVKWW